MAMHSGIEERRRRIEMRKSFFYSVVVGVGVAGSASASSVLQFDVNSLLAQAIQGNMLSQAVQGDQQGTGQQTEGGAFSDTFTGSIFLNEDDNSTLADMLINGNAQNIASDQLMSFFSQVDLVNGNVVGGSVSISDTSGNTYQAFISAGGSVFDLGVGSDEPGRFLINGFTFAGEFNTNTFAGVDVSLWADAEPLIGSFLDFKFTPDVNGMDDDTDVDLFVVVPTPAPAAMGFLGLAGLGAIRRRRA